MRQNGTDQPIRPEIEQLHLASGLVIAELLDNAVDRPSRVVDEHVDVRAALFQLLDQLAAVSGGDVEREPLAAFALDLRD
jgi:hypothetical protein